MREKLELREDDACREARLRQFLVEAKQMIRATLVATPILVGGMYFLMRNVPKDAFPTDFWAIAIFASLSPMILLVGIYYPIYRWIRLKCILSPQGIQFGMPVGKFIRWGLLTEWQLEDSQEHPHHFVVGFRPRPARRFLQITLSDEYSREAVRSYVVRYTEGKI